MSLILDALRKMELERKARRQSSREFRSEVLNYRGVTSSSRPGIALVAATLLVVSAIAAGIFYFTREEPQRNDPVKVTEPLRQEQPVVVPRQPVPVQPAQPLPQQNRPSGEKNPPEIPRPAAKAAVVSSQKTGDEGITVSGIAWQDERYLRRAVINGALVGEGAEVLGAKVVEIRENRVRFSRGGEFFEVVYSSGSGK